MLTAKLSNVASFYSITCPSTNIALSSSVKSITGTAADDIAMMINEVNNVVANVNLIICDSSPDFANKVVRPWLDRLEWFLWPCVQYRNIMVLIQSLEGLQTSQVHC